MCLTIIGVYDARGGDGDVCRSHYTDALYREAEALQLHIGQSAYSKTSIWDEGKPFSKR